MIDVTIDRAALEADCTRVLDALARAAEDGLDRASELTAAQARAVHPYQNRTTDLQSSTQAIPVAGSFYDDSLQASAAATMPYASYVEASHPYLQPAYDAQAGRIEHEVLFLLEQAAR